MKSVVYEICKLSDKECFFLSETHLNVTEAFCYPIHRHAEYELTLLWHCNGCRRIVGDSIETTGAYDMALICNSELPHAWDPGTSTEKDISQILIQFSSDLVGERLLKKNQFLSISKMFEAARNGIVFSEDTIVGIFSSFLRLAAEEDGFFRLLEFFKILHLLSLSEYRTLSSPAIGLIEEAGESRRIIRVKEYIDKHYREQIQLGDVANLVSMSCPAFCRFFKKRTNKTLTEYVIDVRLGAAARQIIDGNKNISEICFDCGFNNVSNFNRAFRAKYNLSPREFKAEYIRKQIFV